MLLIHSSSHSFLNQGQDFCEVTVCYHYKHIFPYEIKKIKSFKLQIWKLHDDHSVLSNRKPASKLTFYVSTLKFWLEINTGLYHTQVKTGAITTSPCMPQNDGTVTGTRIKANLLCSYLPVELLCLIFKFM